MMHTRKRKQDYEVPEDDARVEQIGNPYQSADAQHNKAGNGFAAQNPADRPEKACKARDQGIHFEGPHFECNQGGGQINDLQRNKNIARLQ